MARFPQIVNFRSLVSEAMRSMLGLIVLAFWQSLAAAAVPAADASWEKGDYRNAFAQAIEPAIRGDAHAQFLIGQAYRLGRSVDPNFPQAELWYTRAARQGDVVAATELGLLLAGQHREGAALPWLTMAAQHGEPRALCSLAALYFNGEGVARNEPLAYALMVRAAKAGLPEAKVRLATLRGLLSPEAQDQGEGLVASAIPGVALPPVTIAVEMPAARDAAASATGAPLRIQVGAYHSAAAAEKAWTQLVGQISGLKNTDHAVVQAGAIYRLQARLPDRQAADDFCRRLTAAGWLHFTRKGTARA
jgi:TPR repeat protein